MTINERIKFLRELLRMTQSELGEIIGTKQTTLSMIEKGNNGPSRKIIDSLLNNIDGLKSDWLLRGEGDVFREGSRHKAVEISFRQVKGKNNMQSVGLGENNNNSDNELIAFLKEQIRQKDEQLREKDQQIRHLSQLLQEAMKSRG